MNQENQILEELQEISPLVSNIPRTTPYLIDSDYFVSVPVYLYGISEIKNPYTVSKDYFQNFAASIYKKCKETDENYATPTLGQTKQNPYHLPENYFAQFEAQLGNQLKGNTRQGLLARIGPWRYWSAAACIIGIVGFALFAFLNTGSQKEDWKTSWNEAKKIINEGNFESEFNSINTEVMAAYLTEQGHDVDAAVTACIAEESEQEYELFYLENEKGIEAFLNNTNLELN
jgi:hypothetical protein